MSGNKRRMTSDASATAQLRKQRAKVAFGNQQHLDMMLEINEILKSDKSIVPATLHALRSGMFVASEADDAAPDLFTHNVTRFRDIPNYWVLEFLLD